MGPKFEKTAILKTKKHYHALTILVVQEQTVYDITVEKKEFLNTLETNLPIFEEQEMYEECAEIMKAIEYIKSMMGNPYQDIYP